MSYFKNNALETQIVSEKPRPRKKQKQKKTLAVLTEICTSKISTELMNDNAIATCERLNSSVRKLGTGYHTHLSQEYFKPSCGCLCN